MDEGWGRGEVCGAGRLGFKVPGVAEFWAARRRATAWRSAVECLCGGIVKVKFCQYFEREQHGFKPGAAEIWAARRQATVWRSAVECLCRWWEYEKINLVMWCWAAWFQGARSCIVLGCSEAGYSLEVCCGVPVQVVSMLR